METTNLLGISDRTMVDRIHAEKPSGGATTLAVYERYSAFGFSRLRKSSRFAALPDLEKREVAYDAAGRFLSAIFSGVYQPLPETLSDAFFWTICYRRGIDALRKRRLGQPKAGEPDTGAPAEYSQSAQPSFARVVALDDDPTLLGASQADDLIAWLDTQLIWETARKYLGEHCYEILVETIQKDRPQKEYSDTKGYAKGSLKTMKTNCLAQLRALLRRYL